MGVCFFMSNILDKNLVDELPNKVRKPSRKLGALTYEERERRGRELLEALKHLNEKEKELRKANPFWFYAPVSGEISGERRKFLGKYLKEDDIPQKLDSAVDYHCSPASIRGASGGNQSSKTTSLIMDFLITATGTLPYVFDENEKKLFKYKIPEKRWKRPEGEQRHTRIIGEDYQNGIVRNLIPALRKWTPVEYLLHGKFDDSYSAGEQVLRLFKPGTRDIVGTIELMSSKQELGSFQGPPRQKLGFDEEPPHEVYKENRMRFVTSGDLDISFAMTPTKGLSWTYDLYTKGKDTEGTNIDWFQIASVCNPHANLAVLDEIVSDMESYDEIRMRLLGEFISLSGLVYGKLFDPKIHVIDPFETSCSCGGRGDHAATCPAYLYIAYLGVDAHMVKDSCAVLAVVDQEDNFIVDRCYKRDVDTVQFKKDMWKEEFLLKRRIGRTVFDPSNDSSIKIFDGRNIFKECTTGPFRIPKAIKADKFHGSIAAGVDNIKRRLKINPRTDKPTFFIMNRPENQMLIKSMKTLQREMYVNEDVKGQKDQIAEGVHDHHACVRYLNQMKLRWYPPVDPVMDNPYEGAGLL